MESGRVLKFELQGVGKSEARNDLSFAFGGDILILNFELGGGSPQEGF